MYKLETKECLLLDGEWEFEATGVPGISGLGQVPGSVFVDLLHNGLIEDPFVGKNEGKCGWIAETGWVYRKRFVLPVSLLEAGSCVLIAEGLDTVAEVLLNGCMLGKADNMFRAWEWPLPEGLEAGEHVLEVRFPSITKEVEKRREGYPLNAVGIGTFRLDGAQWLRKAAYHFGWDWGPKLPDVGIWKSLRIESRAGLRIADVRVEQRHHADGRVSLLPQVELCGDGDSEEVLIEWALKGPGGCLLKGAAVVANRRELTLDINVAEPCLWWPNGMGEAHLYELSIRLTGSAGKVVDVWEKRIGLRIVELDTTTDEDGHRFGFVVNGKPVFIKGANWIPADVFLPRIGDDVYKGLLRSAVLANMNMIRVWGGGIYEADVFYDFCDEHGLLVWQDFMYACSAYPANDLQWMENGEAEARQQVRRLRHHACIALYCGNNEMEQFPQVFSPEPVEGAMSPDSYGRLFEKCLREVVRDEHSEIAYWRSSPHSLNGLEATSAKAGDVHIWTVWWGMKPFHHYRSIRPRFCSEFGFQSLPHPQTIGPVLESDDQRLEGEAMGFRQRGVTNAGPGNTTLLNYMRQHLGYREDATEQLWLTQVLQAMALETGCDAWMSEWPYCQGLLYWQLNDCWPGPSWATVDYNGVWKVAHYAVRRMFQANVLLWKQAVSDEGEPVSPVSLLLMRSDKAVQKFHWQLERRNAVGEVLESRSGVVVPDLTVDRELTQLASEDLNCGTGEFLVAYLTDGHDEIARRIFVGSEPPHGGFAKPEVHVREVEAGSVAISAEGAPAFWIWIEGDEPGAIFSDNGFHLMPGEEKIVRRLDKGELPGKLRAWSLLG